MCSFQIFWAAMSETGSGKQLLRGHSFAMERMMAKDEEDRLDRVNTKQKRGTPTVSYTRYVIRWTKGVCQGEDSFL